MKWLAHSECHALSKHCPIHLGLRLHGLRARHLWTTCPREGGELWRVNVATGGEFVLCMPRTCTPRSLHILALQFLRALPEKFETCQEEVALERLADWRALRLDFVIAGFAKAGTSTLVEALSRGSAWGAGVLLFRAGVAL